MSADKALYILRVMGKAGQLLGAALVAALAAMVLSACGSSSTSPSPPNNVQEPSLLSESELSKYPEGSVEQAFYEYWSNLQYQSWAEVASYYDPRLRDYIGTSKVIGAKKLGASSYPLMKPKVVRVSSGRGTTTVYYTVVLPEGTKELGSITWRKEGGNWDIIYDSRLDAELSQAALTLAEAKSGSTPTEATPASPEAVRAGKEAEQLQARFLQEELHVNRP